MPFRALGDPPFSLLHQNDAVAALMAALRRPVDGPVNVVGAGAVTASQAARLGRRVPVPTLAVGWPTTRLVSGLAGAPVPDHVHELLTRGRVADGSRVAELLGVRPERSTAEVVEDLYAWADVERVVSGTIEEAA